MEELKNCPFCGFESVDFELTLGWRAGCKACTASVMGFNRENAIHKWNTRATDPLLEEMAQALERVSEDGHALLSMTIGSRLVVLEALQKYRATLG